MAEGIRPLCLVGIAGTTETGNIDPLDELADLAQELGCHYHVDAAWGGATLALRHLQGLLKGIERADSVTIDAHKQLYVPMGAGMVLFKDPTALAAIEHHAAYILREGSRDLGSHTLEGSRPGMAMLVHAGLSIIGRKGYEILIDQGIERACRFAQIDAHPDFELITEPELNILTYRYNPAWIQAELAAASRRAGRAHQRNPRQGHRDHAEAAARKRPHLRFPHAPRAGPLPRQTGSPCSAWSWPTR
jgi:glutamate decarboxylase